VKRVLIPHRNERCETVSTQVSRGVSSEVGSLIRSVLRRNQPWSEGARARPEGRGRFCVGTRRVRSSRRDSANGLQTTIIGLELFQSNSLRHGVERRDAATQPIGREVDNDFIAKTGGKGLLSRRRPGAPVSRWLAGQGEQVNAPVPKKNALQVRPCGHVPIGSRGSQIREMLAGAEGHPELAPPLVRAKQLRLP
jgi:hypothetical protein